MKSIDFNFVADLYDSYVKVDFDLDFYEKLVSNCNGKCLELMCGTGRVSIPLLKQNIDLTCVDYSGYRVKNIYGDYNFSPYTETSMFMNIVFHKG